jgi:hypothetical protein
LYISFWVIQTPGNYPEESVQRTEKFGYREKVGEYVVAR